MKTKLRSKLKVKNTFAFTLVELLVVIAIIGILATLAMVSYTGSQRQARDTQRKSDLKQYQTALEVYANGNDGLYVTTSGYLPDESICATKLQLSNCPDDPGDLAYSYSYTTSDAGVSFALSAQLESKANTYWVVCSGGKTGEVTTATPIDFCTN